MKRAAAHVVFCLTLSMLGGVDDTHAASFDCTKASSKMEKTICGDPELSKLDEQLGGAYKTARGVLSPDASKKLATGQQSWLTYTSKMCFANYEGGDAEAADALSCLKEQFTARAEQLQASSTLVGGLKTY